MYANVITACWTVRVQHKFLLYQPSPTNKTIDETLLTTQEQRREITTLAGRLVQQMLVWMQLWSGCVCECVARGAGWCNGSHLHFSVVNLLSFTRDHSLPGGQCLCFLSSLCLFEKDSRAQRVLLPSRTSDGPHRGSAFHHPGSSSSKNPHLLFRLFTK